MRKLITVVGIALVAMITQAQTNYPMPSLGSGLSEIASAFTSATNWAVVGSVGRSLTGNKNVASEVVAYNFMPYGGLVLGVDQLWNHNFSQNNTIKGGVTINATIKPFAFIGSTSLTNVVGTVFAYDLLANPSGNGSTGIGNLVGTGVSFDLYQIKNFELSVNGQYEHRTGQGSWDGNYILFGVSATRRF